MRVRSVLSAAILRAAASCSGGEATPPGTNGTTGTSGTTGTTGTTGGGGSTSNAITVDDNSFTPSATTVPVNTTVTWTWVSIGTHNVTFANTALGGSGDKVTGTYSKAFPTAGEFAYQCSLHGASMSGTITVQSDATTERPRP